MTPEGEQVQKTVAPVTDPPPSSVEQKTQRVTASDVEKARIERETSSTALMDEMEASIATQGQWFIKLGAKTPLTETRQETSAQFMGLRKKTTEKPVEVGVKDRRVLILNAEEHDEEKEYRGETKTYREVTMVTREGIKTVRMLNKSTDSYRSDYGEIAHIIDQLRNGDEPADGCGLSAFSMSEQRGGVIRVGYKPDPHKFYDRPSRSSSAVETVTELNLHIGRDAKDFAGTPEDFQERVKNSIEITESPHKKAMGDISAQTAVATSATSMIRGLPPR